VYSVVQCSTVIVVHITEENTWRITTTKHTKNLLCYTHNKCDLYVSLLWNKWIYHTPTYNKTSHRVHQPPLPAESIPNQGTLCTYVQQNTACGNLCHTSQRNTQGINNWNCNTHHSLHELHPLYYTTLYSNNISFNLKFNNNYIVIFNKF
jgi:hypothetical protein